MTSVSKGFKPRLPLRVAGGHNALRVWSVTNRRVSGSSFRRQPVNSQHFSVPAPYFCLARGAFIPCAIAWDPVSGLFERHEGPDGFTTWEEADEAKSVPRPGNVVRLAGGRARPLRWGRSLDWVTRPGHSVCALLRMVPRAGRARSRGG